ncbi:proline dehydrogenase [Methylomonas sp. DH-1]|uniref:proline dehydrogenase n=1 Tax=Methylomonas sp. (strain DH-1) TaxID=1727196 RepID=UPI000AA50FC6|nr:proline dehydrogenase [Methylomonas sp. DH-1]
MVKTWGRRIVGKGLRLVLRIAGRVYVPGSRLEDAMRVARRLSAQQLACTLGYFHNWLEPQRQETPEQVAAVCRRIIAAIAELPGQAYLSVKAPALAYDAGLLDQIAGAARDAGMLLHFDSHEPLTADATLACVRNALAEGAAVGLSVPGRWRRSLADADLACELGVRVRVVKGEWPDPLDADMDMREGFLRVVERLAGRAASVALASHDPWLVREALLRLRAAGTPCEIELLHGLPKRRLLALAREFSVPVRVYIPFGIAWRPYALAKAADNPRLLWWVIRDSVVGLLLSLRRLPGRIWS